MKELSLEYLEQFEDFKKFAFIHKALLANTSLINILSPKEYKEYIEYFYNQS